MSACSECRFFNATLIEQTYQGVRMGDPIKGHGFCRANAPVADARGVGKFPVVPATEWCGRFEPKVQS